MNFSFLTCCPFCGNDEYYTSQQFKGICNYKERFDGTEADNSDIHDNIVYYGGNKAYCSRCRKYLGNRTRDTVSLEVEKLFKRKLIDLRNDK